MRKLILLAILLVCVLSSCALFTQQGIEVFNESASADIWYVLISESTNTEWGEDKLGSNEEVVPGESRFFQLWPGTYDIKVIFDNGANGELYGIEIGSEEVHNVTIDDIEIVHIPPTNSGSSRGLSPGEEGVSLIK